MKKQEKDLEKMTLLRDSREQDGKGWEFRASENCHGMEIIKLDVGDYAIKGLEHVIMVERKTIGDLWGTLGNPVNYQRFLAEMDRAKKHRLKYLVIEAQISEIQSGYKWSRVPAANILAKLVSLEVKHDVRIIFAGRLDTARAYVRDLFYKLYRYSLEGVLPKVKNVTDSTAATSTDTI